MLAQEVLAQEVLAQTLAHAFKALSEVSKRRQVGKQPIKGVRCAPPYTGELARGGHWWP